ncbi:hypothetical protein BO86DRAFT_388533 [Aspergillus japonicus CBS 114.51]|uniref:Uncharacterized protein n=1 Tax=Aspergillus japonicus CBS 114.51 TaxID=1448312 RepID=A0A8T8X5C4_ASPJA|nr:hypothetical protein BO86DRAFT_388533 [Aspergillus japonicus CBS 114.51]RAH82689.1 hypothetical protein BO86DRAFT_388533 [Aspergillus japonicus CBS 114.51]
MEPDIVQAPGVMLIKTGFYTVAVSLPVASLLSPELFCCRIIEADTSQHQASAAARTT